MNAGHVYREQLGPEAEGQSLGRHLAERYRHSTADDWLGRIRAGLVTLDGQPARAKTPLRRGQWLAWHRPPWREPAAPAGFAVLYDDGDVLAVHKPAGLPTLPGGGFRETTLLHRVSETYPEAAPLHRLGRFTSGAVLFARTDAARAALAAQFRERSIRKRYRALAGGSPAADVFEITTPIGPVPHALLGTVHGASAAGRDAHSRVTVLGRRDLAFLCDVEIASGRPHQIRVHLAAAGFPLVGDPLYAPGGIPAPGCRALPGDGGYLLHAAEIVFRSPGEGRWVAVACPPPEALEVGSLVSSGT